MDVSRRDFLKKAGWAGASGAVMGLGPGRAGASEARAASEDWMGVLVDIPKCIGCRRCEAACNQTHGFEVPTDQELQDKLVFMEHRRPGPHDYTTINPLPQPLFRLGADFQNDLDRTAGVVSDRLAEEFSQHGISLAEDAIVTIREPGQRWGLVSGAQALLIRRKDEALGVFQLGPTYVKSNCFHCNDPVCVSACLVGAFSKQCNGAVTYEAWKCMGCRYCMMACPFQIPTYEYDNPVTPQVRKCTFCFDRISIGGAPACVQACPKEVMTFGPRSELLARAHAKIGEEPEVYSEHIYGEHEVGGTSWMYLGPKQYSFEELGFLKLPASPPPMRTERIQHGIFKYFIPPLAWYGLLGAVMWVTRPNADGQEHAAAKESGVT
ncbi:MAG: 4Fe-4S dicluster domain-containing protein [Planctomycetota bacterium]